jgi:transposase
MPNPYSLELRTRAVTAYESGAGTYEMVAEQFIIGSATVKRWVARLRAKGHVQPERKGGGTPSQIALPELEAIVARLHDATAGEIAAEYNRGRRGRARRHVSSIKRALYRAGYVVKKNASGRWSSSAPTSSSGGRGS